MKAKEKLEGLIRQNLENHQSRFLRELTPEQLERELGWTDALSKLAADIRNEIGWDINTDVPIKSSEFTPAEKIIFGLEK